MNDYLTSTPGEWLAGAAFLALLGVCGMVLVRRTLHESDPVSILGLGGFLGIGGFILLYNAFGFAVGIDASFWISIAVISVVATISEIRAQRLPHDPAVPGPLSTDSSRRRLAVVVAVSTVTSLASYFTTLRTFLYDDFAASHVPTALLIANGRFPVEEPGIPGSRFSYHYAPELLAAAMNRASDLPVWYTYDVQIAAFTFLMVPLALTLGRIAAPAVFVGVRRAPVAAFIALMVVFNGPWRWLDYFRDPDTRAALSTLASSPTDSIATLADRVAAVTNVSFGYTSNSIIVSMHNHSTAIGFVAALAALYWLIRAVRDVELSRRGRAYIAAMAVIAFSLLALSTETILAILVPGILVFAVVESIRVRRWRPVFVTLAIGLATYVIATNQGGVLTDPITHGSDEGTFVLAKEFGQIATGRGEIPLWDWRILSEWVPVLALSTGVLVGSVLAVLRVRRKKGDVRTAAAPLPLILGAFVSAFASWLVPIVLYYTPLPFEAIRFFFPALVLFSAVAGVGVAWIYSRLRFRAIALILVAACIASSVSYLVRFSLYEATTTTMTSEDGSVAAVRPEVSPLRPAALGPPWVAWDSKHTDVLEYMLSLPGETVIAAATHRGVYDFMLINGHQFQPSYYPERDLEINQVMNALDADAMRDYGIDVLYVNFPDAVVGEIPIEKLADPDDFEEIHTIGDGLDRDAFFRVLPKD